MHTCSSLKKKVVEKLFYPQSLLETVRLPLVSSVENDMEKNFGLYKKFCDHG